MQGRPTLQFLTDRLAFTGNESRGLAARLYSLAPVRAAAEGVRRYAPLPSNHPSEIGRQWNEKMAAGNEKHVTFDTAGSVSQDGKINVRVRLYLPPAANANIADWMEPALTLAYFAPDRIAGQRSLFQVCRRDRSQLGMPEGFMEGGDGGRVTLEWSGSNGTLFPVHAQMMAIIDPTQEHSILALDPLLGTLTIDGPGRKWSFRATVAAPHA